MTKLPQGPADKVRAEACLHSDHHTRWQLLKVSASASRLILRRKAILPSVPKPTMWKTSLPMSMPIEAREGVMVSMGCFSVCCDVVFADYPRRRGKQPVHPITGPGAMSALS